MFNPSHPAPPPERGSVNRSKVTRPAGVISCPRIRPHVRTLLRATPRSAIRAPISPSIKAKKPVIVPHQGISRQTLKFPNTISRVPTARPQTSPAQCPGFAPYMAPALKRRPILAIKAKNSAIVFHQASSRQPVKITNATYWPRRPNLPRAISSAIGCWAFDDGCWMFPIAPPSNQGSSCLIKAITGLLMSQPLTNPSRGNPSKICPRYDCRY